MFFPYILSCEAHKQFGAESAQYGLEINFKFYATRPRVYLIGTSVQLVKSRTGDHLNRLHGFDGFVNRWSLMPCINTESRRTYIFFLLICYIWTFIYGLWCQKGENSYISRSHSNELTNFQDLYQSYQHGCLFLCKKLTWIKSNYTTLICPSECWKLHFGSTKFPGGACLRNPPDTAHHFPSGGRLFKLPSFQTHCKLSLNYTGCRVLELLSVRRIFLVPKGRICKLSFFWDS